MLSASQDVCRVVLKSDPTVSPAERHKIFEMLRNHGRVESVAPALVAITPTGPRFMRRVEVAGRFGVSVRTVDKYSQKGLLCKRTLPGHKRASGFLAADVEALLTGARVAP